MYVLESKEFDSHIIYPPFVENADGSEPSTQNSNKLLHFVGNGVVGAETRKDSPLYIKSDKVLSLAVPFQPITNVFHEHHDQFKEASVLQIVIVLGNPGSPRGSIETITWSVLGGQTPLVIVH